MKDIWQALEVRLVEYRDVYLDIQRFLSVLKSECDTVLVSIVNCESFDAAQLYFDRLCCLQNKISTVKYKYEFPLPDELDLFVHEFERDDLYSRRYWYEELRKKGGYGWPS